MFGWLKDKESPQDYKFSYNPSLSLPKEIDLVKNFPLVYNQLNTSSCVAHAVSMAYMIQLLQQKEKFFSPSRLFIYFNARQIDNPRIIRDEGTYLKSGIKSVAQFGACDESIWKFDTSKVNIKPSKLTNSKFDPYISGLTKQVEKYERVPKSREAIKNALFQGSAVVFGVYLYSKFQEQLEKNNYVFQLPERGDYMMSGHAVIVTGFSDEKQAFKVRNSWSKYWGINGDFWMPYIIMESQFVDDLWKITFIEK